MGRSPCCDKTKVKKGPWSAQEDALLLNFIATFGNGGNWISLPKKAGLNRCGKSCRLRYLNYLRPDIKHGGFTEEEDYVIYKLFNAIGSRWAIIASNLPGRTDNDVKNYWNTKLKRKISSGEFNIINNPITNSCKKHNNNNNSQLINNENITITIEKDRSYYEIESLNMVESKESTEEIPSYYSGYSSSNSTDFNGINREEDEFWMDLLADSFDSSVVAVASHQLQEKMNEIASLLHHNT